MLGLAGSRNGAWRRVGVAAAVFAATSLGVVATAGAQPTVGATGQPGPARMVTPLSDATRSVDVNIESGNLLLTETDLADANSTYHVVYRRSYNSLSSIDGIIGKRWVLNVSPQVFITQSGSVATVHGPDGFNVTMDDNGDGTYTAIEGFDGTLTRAGNGTYTLTRGSTGDIFTFNSQGVLTHTTDATGRTFTVANTSAAGKTVLSSYGTADGRRINVSYNGDSRVREIDDPASTHRYYTYGSAGYLNQYTGPAGNTTYTYNANGHLTYAAYPDGVTVAIVPLTDGRTSSVTIHRPGGSADQTWSFAYGAHQTTVTAPGGAQTTYYFGGDELLVDEPGTLDAVAETYSSDYGVSQSVAQQWMVVQGRAQGADDEIIVSDAGPAFGGIWFDNDTRTVKVAARGDAPAGVIQSIMNSHLVADQTDIVTVEYSQHDLQLAQPGLSDSVEPLIEAGVVRVRLDIPQNALVAEVASSATAPQRQQVVSAAAESTVRVLVNDVTDTTFDQPALACTPTGDLPVYCDDPLRGGIRIESLEFDDGGSDSRCTAGFIAFGTGERPAMPKGEPFVLTAGHCLSNFTPSQSTWAHAGVNGIYNIGSSALFFFGQGTDVGAIHADQAESRRSWVMRGESTSGSTTRMVDYPIRSSALNHEGQYLCLSGATHGTRCGRIIQLGVDQPVGGVPMRDLAAFHSCGAGPGDSGGPLYIGFHAHGTLSGGDGCRFVFVGARTAEFRLGVRIGPPQ